MVVTGPSGPPSDDSDGSGALSQDCLPVTALAFLRTGAGRLLLAAGTGAELVLYNVDRSRRREVSRTRILLNERIHGISATSEEAICRLVCRGGRELVICHIAAEADAAIKVSVDGRARCRHWIFDARLVLPLHNQSLSRSKLICLTAHNAVLFYDAPPASARTDPLELRPPTAIRCRSQPLLYSGCFGPTVDSGAAVLVAAGTAMGPLYVWRCPLGTFPPDDVPTSQVMAGHAGAAFDLKFSSCGDTLVSVSDERTLRIWSVRLGDDSTQGDPAAAKPEPSEHVLWGHLGRIWRVAWAGQDEGSRQTVLTVGEDGRGILWARKPDESWYKRGSLESGHDGRSLWSVAADPRSRLAATGGADGAICLWPAPSLASSVSSQDLHGLVIADPNGGYIKAFEILDDGLVYFVTRAGELFATSNDAMPSKTASSTLVLSAPKDLGDSVNCRFGTTSSCVFVCSPTGTVFAIARDGHAPPRRIQLVDATVSAWKPVDVNGVSWALISDRRQSAVKLFRLEPASGQVEVTTAASFRVETSTYVSSLHLASLGPSTSVLFAGTRAGDLLIWRVGSQGSTAPLLTRINDAGVSRVDTWTEEDGLGLQTLSRDGVLGRHLLKPDLSLTTLDDRKLMQGALEYVVRWRGRECFVGVEDGRCKVLRRSGELIAQWNCGTKEREWKVAPHGPGLAFFSNRNGVIVCQSWNYDPRLARPHIEPGGHGREIRSVALYPLDRGTFLSATAAENGVLRITACECISLTWGDRLKPLQDLPGQRPRLVLMDSSFADSLKSVVWYSERAAGPVFLAVAGSRELLKVFKVRQDTTPSDGVHIMVRSWIAVSAPQAGSDLRIVGLDFGVLASGSSKLLAGYSDGSVKVWALDLRLRSSQLLHNFDRRPCCILAVKWLNVAEAPEGMGIVVGTDGRLAVYNPPTAAARELSRPHVNGINCLDVIRADGFVLAATGGDDTDLVVSSFAWPDLEQAPDPIRVTGAHLTSITGLRFVQAASRTLVVTASTDQRVKLWALGSGSLELLEQADTLVTDVASLDVLRIADGLVAQVVGAGSEIVRFQHCIA